MYRCLCCGFTLKPQSGGQFELARSGAGRQATREDVLLQLDRAYCGALRAQAVLTVAEETVKERHLVADQATDLAKSKLESGLDVSFANVNFAEAKVMLVSPQNDVTGAFAELAAALGYQDSPTFSLVGEPLAAPPPPDVSDLVAQATQSRPELASLRHDSESATRFAKAERALWFPTPSLAGSEGLIPFHRDTLTNRYAAAGLNINIPIIMAGSIPPAPPRRD